MKYDVTFRFQKADHTGFCAGDNCVYSESTHTIQYVELKTPLEKGEDMEFTVTRWNCIQSFFDNDQDPLTKAIKMFIVEHNLLDDANRSFMCTISLECVETGLERHTARITVYDCAPSVGYGDPRTRVMQ